MTRRSDDNKLPSQNLLALRALESILAQQNVNKRQIYFQNFVRGIFFSLGSLVGLALAGTLVLWVLSLFDSFPLIDQISKSIQASLK